MVSHKVLHTSLLDFTIENQHEFPYCFSNPRSFVKLHHTKISQLATGSGVSIDNVVFARICRVIMVVMHVCYPRSNTCITLMLMTICSNLENGDSV